MGSKIEVHTSRLIDNGGQDCKRGAVIRSMMGSNVLVRSSQLSRNTAMEGGAIYIGNASQAVVTNSFFELNVATAGPGGAIYVAGYGALLTIESTMFFSNAETGESQTVAACDESTVSAPVSVQADEDFPSLVYSFRRHLFETDDSVSLRTALDVFMLEHS